jgi:hypothetical protein
MTNLRNTRHEARGHPGRSTTAPWRPVVAGPPVALPTSGPGRATEDPAALLAGERLARHVRWRVDDLLLEQIDGEPPDRN